MVSTPIEMTSIYEPQVIYLQETFLVQPSTPILNYHFTHSPHSIADASIFIHHKTPHIYLNIETTIPCTLLRIFLQRWITIVSVYFSPFHPIDFDNLHDLIFQLPYSSLIIVGDFNSRYTLWGDSVVNSCGYSLERSLSTSFLNSDLPTHFDTRTQFFPCLDLFLCTPSLSLYFH